MDKFFFYIIFFFFFWLELLDQKKLDQSFAKSKKKNK